MVPRSIPLPTCVMAAPLWFGLGMLLPKQLWYQNCCCEQRLFSRENKNYRFRQGWGETTDRKTKIVIVNIGRERQRKKDAKIETDRKTKRQSQRQQQTDKETKS